MAEIKEILSANLFDFSKTIAASLFENATYPHEVLGEIESFIKTQGKTLSPFEYTDLGDNIWVHKAAKIAKTACVNAPVIICENAEIRHTAFIRGSVIVGKSAVVGNSTELKNSILYDCVQAPHYNYIGDSILGYKAHTGAGVILSNVKADKSSVVIRGENFEIQTGRKKLGAILGDFAEIGCGIVLNPGTVICKNATVQPLSSVRGVVAENMIYKKSGEVVKKIITNNE